MMAEDHEPVGSPPVGSQPVASPAGSGGQPQAADGAVTWEVRKLLRAARVATLATVADGQPFASLVTPAFTPDLCPLLLLSSLSEHTRHLRADPRCSLLVCGAATGPNPQTASRVTLTGVAEVVADPALKARFLAVHPYASLYADFGDFAVWRVQVRGALFVGGFARAVRLRASALAPDAARVAAVAEAEAAILQHCNDDHADALAAIAAASGAAPGPWRMVVADSDGFDLAADERVIRIPWTAPVGSAGSIRDELVRMTHAARSAQGRS
ncbi:MAG TPA: pyridoxamine 5'-phosphate oxidase family protein [Acetobacteraceae bacterium]|nr:pyridoxamine 5'-phosphate oxidase family protein [Acetobacteraceae bacterium]